MLDESIFAAQLPNPGVMISFKCRTDRQCHDTVVTTVTIVPNMQRLRSLAEICPSLMTPADVLAVLLRSLNIAKKVYRLLPPVRLVLSSA